MALELDRRAFLRSSAAGVATLAIGLGRLRPAVAEVASPPVYSDWHDVYRRRWTWDKVVRSTHFVNCWYQAHCAWDVYVKDGVVWREEQAGDYPQIRPDVPDFNPRGCQKGACFSERMVDPARVRYPLKRVGERGSGKWQRVEWEQALDEIADSMIDTITGEGSDRVIWELGPLYTFGTMGAAHLRLSLLLDATSLDMNTEIGDGRRGTAETFGKIVFERSADDFCLSDLIFVWGANPVYTQIPNAHFLLEARYKGAQIVCIAPDYSASAMHADVWVPVQPGRDAALALGMAHVLIEEKLYDRDFVVEQTDLPILVREDTRRYLRASDVDEGGAEDGLYLHDPERGIVPAPRRSLALGELAPSLEGRFEVRLRDGRSVSVRPVFDLLRERLREYSPEKASRICGTAPASIRDLAQRMSRARAASAVATSNFCKFYHGNLIERSLILVFALAGQFGKKGSGFAGFPFLHHDGLSKMALTALPEPLRSRMLAALAPDVERLAAEGYTREMIVYEADRRAKSTGGFGFGASGALFWYVHGGLLEASERLQEWDPYLKRPIRAVLDESLEKGWQYVWPKPGSDPRVMLSMGSNPLRRVRSYPLLLEHLWPKLRTIVSLDWRMTSTGLYSDYVLPVAAWYEHTEHKWATPLMPFIHSGEKATSYYEAKSDWEIHARLAMAIQKRARERGLTRFRDRYGNERTLDDVYDNFSEQGKYGPTDDEKVARTLIELADNLEGVRWKTLKKRGWARFTATGDDPTSIGTATEIRADDTITPLVKHAVDKEPYPTLSRRIQFYIDQELYLEMGEELPVHKDPPEAGGKHPLILTGGHTRWSIHSAWRDDRLMLQQQRGEPVLYMSVEDARARGIRDGGRVRVFNDLDSFVIMAKTSAAVRPGQLILYHAWENFQFPKGRGFQNLIPTPLNPVELAGGQYHLRPMTASHQPSHTDRDTRVQVEALSSAGGGPPGPSGGAPADSRDVSGAHG